MPTRISEIVPVDITVDSHCYCAGFVYQILKVRVKTIFQVLINRQPAVKGKVSAAVKGSAFSSSVNSLRVCFQVHSFINDSAICDNLSGLMCQPTMVSAELQVAWLSLANAK